MGGGLYSRGGKKKADAAIHRQNKREATRLGKLISYVTA